MRARARISVSRRGGIIAGMESYAREIAEIYATVTVAPSRVNTDAAPASAAKRRGASHRAPSPVSPTPHPPGPPAAVARAKQMDSSIIVRLVVKIIAARGGARPIIAARGN